VVFKRRDRRSISQAAINFVYPRGGWTRAFRYVQHRLRRLPDTPEKIARGIWAGVFTTFTPFYGLHFIIAGLIAVVMRGNILAALLATFFGNPLTYVPIAVVALQTGSWLLGARPDAATTGGIGTKFTQAFGDLWHNFKAVFTPEEAHWTFLIQFYDEVFFPYMVGGIIPGIVAATIAYLASVPVIRAYQNRRRKALRKKLSKLSPPTG